jgi:hypothetical protein
MTIPLYITIFMILVVLVILLYYFRNKRLEAFVALPDYKLT